MWFFFKTESTCVHDFQRTFGLIVYRMKLNHTFDLTVLKIFMLCVLVFAFNIKFTNIKYKKS